ncbi:hypothetical protein ATANTOWER_008531 [Ataeniobius toweri]|uniref:Uncharacterized protein n=1 Tax=Ataeniobius toweri TaxID=208326 RepID=A0ABU7BNZ8_9TELE|nr:hypothetical protein [Ataeniobius toweri]
MATGVFPGWGPAWASHVKRGPRFSEDMPSATLAPANCSELRWEQLGLRRRVQVQRGREERGIRTTEKDTKEKREETNERRESGRGTHGRPDSTTWESSGLHTSK